MSLKDKIAQLSKTVEKRIDSLDLVVQVSKVTLAESQRLEKFAKTCNENAIDILYEIGKKWIADEDGPIFAEMTKDEVGCLQVMQVVELMDAFKAVNDVNRGGMEKNLTA